MTIIRDYALGQNQQPLRQFEIDRDTGQGLMQDSMATFNEAPIHLYGWYNLYLGVTDPLSANKKFDFGIVINREQVFGSSTEEVIIYYEPDITNWQTAIANASSMWYHRDSKFLNISNVISWEIYMYGFAGNTAGDPGIKIAGQMNFKQLREPMDSFVL